MNDEKILGRKQVKVSGGNLPDNYEARYTLEVVDDITESIKTELMMRSLVIDHQKDRSVKGIMPTLDARTKAGVFRVKASELVNRKRVKVELTPQEIEDRAIEQAKSDPAKKIDLLRGLGLTDAQIEDIMAEESEDEE